MVQFLYSRTVCRVCVSLVALVSASCGTIQQIQMPSLEECKAKYTYNTADRYIYAPLRPHGITAIPTNIPDSLIPPMSTRGLLESCLANPHTQASLKLRKSLARGRQEFFTMNTWQALEQRPDAYQTMMERYDRLEAACSPVIQSAATEDAYEIQAQLASIEFALTRESFLKRLNTLEKRQLAAKVIAKHREKTQYNYDRVLIGMGDGLWLLASLLLAANDTKFSDAIRSEPPGSFSSLYQFTQGEIGTGILQPSSDIETTILRHAERFAAGK